MGLLRLRSRFESSFDSLPRRKPSRQYLSELRGIAAIPQRQFTGKSCRVEVNGVPDRQPVKRSNPSALAETAHTLLAGNRAGGAEIGEGRAD